MSSRASRASSFGGWGSPPGSRRQALRRRAAAALALVACACVAAGAAYALLGTGASHPKLSGGSSPDRASVRTAVDSISAVVATSAADRRRVIAVIDAVQSCSQGASTGESMLQSVVNDRRAAITELERLAAVPPPGIDSTMINDLLTTLNASISDDESYASWMGDIAGGHAACGGNPMADPNFAAAKAQSDRTNLDKQVFVEEWNPLAQRYGKPTYQSEDF